MALDEKQIAHFKEEGYLILTGFIDPQQVTEWRVQFWQHVGADPQDPASWPDSYVLEVFYFLGYSSNQQLFYRNRSHLFIRQLQTRCKIQTFPYSFEIRFWF